MAFNCQIKSRHFTASDLAQQCATIRRISCSQFRQHICHRLVLKTFRSFPGRRRTSDVTWQNLPFLWISHLVHVSHFLSITCTTNASNESRKRPAAIVRICMHSSKYMMISSVRYIAQPYVTKCSLTLPDILLVTKTDGVEKLRETSRQRYHNAVHSECLSIQRCT